jgi:prepilin-type N-terminal cleavage/methylation domain-containing protein
MRSRKNIKPSVPLTTGIRGEIENPRGLKPAARALTLVELLIVIVVIGILVSAILVASSGFINKGRSNNTQSVLQIVADAAEEFKREQSMKPTITRFERPKRPSVGDPSKTTTSYAERYGNYPPDELEVFSSANGAGLPGLVTPLSLAPGGAEVVGPTPPPWGAMRFFKDGTGTDALENRDQAATILAIETLSESASAILDRIPDRNRTPGPIDPASGNPSLFLDRRGGTTAKEKQWDPGDHQIRLIIDDWGNPISYFSERDHNDDVPEIPSSNHPAWNEASTELIRANGGQPVLMSYGPDGKDQLTPDAMGANGTATLMSDMHPTTPGPDDREFVIDNPFNADNVYSNPALKEKLAKGLKP